MTIAAGAKLGRYEIRSKIGEGGMGEVYRARDEKLNRYVAIKVLPASFSQDADRLRRFEQEAQAAGTLNHPNIVAVYDVGTHEEAPYVVSELLEGETLRERLDGPAIPQRKAVDYAAQIARGLAAAHARSIVHRDLKPENIFIAGDGQVKILDFGLAKLIEPASAGPMLTGLPTRKLNTTPAALMGALGYMSPEQVDGNPVDYRSDIFSFGVVLYEMLAGRRPCPQRETLRETLQAIAKEDPPELSELNPQLSLSLVRVVERCLEEKPEDRFQSTRDLAFALEALPGASTTSQPQVSTASNLDLSTAPAVAAPPSLRLWKMLALAAVLAAVAFSVGAFILPKSEQPYDIIIANGRVIDGTGAPWFRADVGIRGDRIVRIGDLQAATAKQRIDATNLVVSPGFIDMLGQSEFNVLVDNRAASKVLQGVTTEITGEGASIAPLNDRLIKESFAGLAGHYHITVDWRSLDEYFVRLEQRTHPAINVGTFVGAGGIRQYVLGANERAATAAEMAEMKRLVAQAMEQGALGLSSSLQYMPDRFATTDELVELAKVAAQYGGIYITHQRSESDKIFESLDEIFAIAERAKIPAEIFHLKTAYKANWGRMAEVLKRIYAARERGLDITADQYPYVRGSNGLDACLPLWVREGGKDKMVARLQDPAQRERAKKEMDDPHAIGWENQWYGSGGSDGVLLSDVLNADLKKYEGKTLTEIGRLMGKDPRDAVMDLVIADHGESYVVTSIMTEDDVKLALKDPLVAVGTDSPAMAEDGPLSDSKSHPRGWGSFPRILGKYVREEHLLTLEEAIRKMTARPAARVGLADRGLLRAGMMADITVFDPATIHEVATFEDPNHYSVGVRWVLVNGRPVVADGKITAERPGRPLRGPGYRK